VKVLVTGANGHVGYSLCKVLLARGGYEVRASVRSVDDADKTRPLRGLGPLELVSLDVRNAAQFDAAVAGVEVLFHVAATYTVVTAGADEDAEMIKDSVEGVEVALRAAAKAKVRKVVLTSSVVALPMVDPGAPAATEDDWRSQDWIPYYRAKTEAERAARQLAEELGLRLVTVLPGGVAGPDFARRTPTINLYEAIMLGSLRMGAPVGNFTFVDVRDVAMGHILAAEKDVAGRFILAEDVSPTFVEVSKVMHEIDSAVPAAPCVLPKFMLRFLPFFDAMNAKRLGAPRTATEDVAATLKNRVWNVTSERARRELGWTIAFPMRRSLEDTMSAIRAMRRSEGKKHMA
jgi:dihydroflavonol-4-reductase